MLLAPEWRLIIDSSDLFLLYFQTICAGNIQTTSCKHMPFSELVWEKRVILPIFVFESVDLAHASKLLLF